jgi:hypothetical protein
MAGIVLMAALIQPTASKGDLLRQCSYPFSALAQIEYKPPGKKAEYGTRFHAGMAALIQRRKPDGEWSDADRLHVLGAYKVLSEWLRLSGWSDGQRLVEQSMALDPSKRTARLSAYDVASHTYPGLGEGEIGGTADLLVLQGSHDRPILVLDHKTGAWGNFTRPAELGQLELLGLMACLIYGRRSYVPAILHSWACRETLVYAAEPQSVSKGILTQWASRIASSTANDCQPQAGHECRFCPAKIGCPAWR